MLSPETDSFLDESCGDRDPVGLEDRLAQVTRFCSKRGILRTGDKMASEQSERTVLRPVANARQLHGRALFASERRMGLRWPGTGRLGNATRIWNLHPNGRS